MNTIVFDLDECLVCVYVENVNWHVYEELKSSKYITKRNNVFLINTNQCKYWGIKRPYLNELLTYAFNTYKNVCVWSAGTKSYVDAVVECIFKGFPSPTVVLTRNDIFQETDKFYCKPLERIFDRLPDSNKHNTLLVDNLLSNSKYDPLNIIHIPDFEPVQNINCIDSNDNCLLQLIKWLQYVEGLALMDVRYLYKKDIFAEPEVQLLNDFIRAFTCKVNS